MMSVKACFRMRRLPDAVDKCGSNATPICGVFDHMHSSLFLFFLLWTCLYFLGMSLFFHVRDMSAGSATSVFASIMSIYQLA